MWGPRCSLEAARILYLSKKAGYGLEGSFPLHLDVSHGVPQGSMVGPFPLVEPITNFYDKVFGSVMFYEDDKTSFFSHSAFE